MYSVLAFQASVAVVLGRISEVLRLNRLFRILVTIDAEVVNLMKMTKNH